MDIYNHGWMMSNALEIIAPSWTSMVAKNAKIVLTNLSEKEFRDIQKINEYLFFYYLLASIAPNTTANSVFSGTINFIFWTFSILSKTYFTPGITVIFPIKITSFISLFLKQSSSMPTTDL